MEDKIRVAHIITRLVTGGADENTVYTVNGLAAYGYKVTLLTGEESEPDFARILGLSTGVELKIIPGLIREISPVSDFRALLSIYRLFKRGNYQIIHTHTAKAGFLGRIAAKLAGIPVIIHSIHGTTFPEDLNYFRRLLFKSLERFAGRYTDFFIPVGHDLKNIYLRAGIGRKEKYRVIYSGMDLEKFYRAGDYSREQKNKIRNKYGIKENEVVIAKVAKLHARKGYHYYLELVERITAAHDNVKFMIVGSGEEESKLKDLVEDKGLAGKVIFTGFQENVEDIFAITDIKVLTSLWEGLPRVLVQAAAARVPVVTFAVEGVSEIVEEGKNGFIVPLKNVALLVERVSALITSAELRQKMGDYGRKKVNSSWSSEEMVAEIKNIYEKLLSGKGLK